MASGVSSIFRRPTGDASLATNLLRASLDPRIHPFKTNRQRGAAWQRARWEITLLIGRRMTSKVVDLAGQDLRTALVSICGSTFSTPGIAAKSSIAVNAAPIDDDPGRNQPALEA
jgi:hypothetical protein